MRVDGLLKGAQGHNSTEVPLGVLWCKTVLFKAENFKRWGEKVADSKTRGFPSHKRTKTLGLDDPRHPRKRNR